MEDFRNTICNWNYNPYTPERKRWRDWLATELVDTHELFAPAMPCKQNADYVAWSIWFKKVIPYLTDNSLLIGHSLGGGFLLRYLTENKLSVTVAQLHLIAPCVDMVAGFDIDLAAWSGFKTAITETHLWHSTDDTVVPLSQSEGFVVRYPTAILHVCDDRFHFLTETFPELLEVIRGV